MKTFNKFTGIFILIVATTSLSACSGTYEGQEVYEQKVSVTSHEKYDLTDIISESILHDPYISQFNIKVSAFHNKVKLSGFVDSYRAKKRAEDIAYSVAGVKSVQNNLVVRKRLVEPLIRYTEHY